MGCDETREDIEEKIVYTRLERDQVRKERQILLNELKVTTGEVIKTEPIPDYVDINYYKEEKRKRIEKEIKKAVKKEEKRKKEEERKKKELEEELKRLEKFGYDEELLYQPLKMRVKNKNSPVDDIYDLDYVLQKKEESINMNNDDEEYEGDENELKENTDKKKKSKSKKKKKVKLNENENEDENDKENESEDKDKDKEKDDKSDKEVNDEEGNEIDNDIMQKVDAKIATKTASIASIVGKKSKNKISNNNSNLEEESRNIPYFTPHLQPND